MPSSSCHHGPVTITHTANPHIPLMGMVLPLVFVQ